MTVLGILALIAQYGPTLWSAGSDVLALFMHKSGDAISKADANGNVDPDAYAELKKMCEDVTAALEARAAEANQPDGA